MADIIQQRRDTAARWAQYNPILLEGEVGYVTDNPNQYKIGNGRDRWNNLPLRGYTGTITQDTGDDENAVMSQKAVTEKLAELGSKAVEIASLTSNVCSNFIEYPGCIVRSATGLIEESEGYNTSEMFAILPSTQYIKNNITFLAFYDAEKQYISREDNPYGTPFTTPSNAHYARASSNTDPSLWQLNVGDTLLDYEYPGNSLKEMVKQSVFNFDVDSLVFARGNLQNNGSIIASTNRIYATDITYRGGIEVKDGWLISSVAYYSEVDGLFDEYIIINADSYRIGKENCYATLVIRKADNSDIEDDSYLPSSVIANSVLGLSKVQRNHKEELARIDGMLRYLYSSSLISNVCSNFIEYPGCIVRSATGLIEESEGYNTSEMFAILPSAQYIKNNLAFLAFYDADKQYISREDNPYGTPFTTPSNAHYARASSNTDPSLWQLNVGDTLLDYEYPASALVAKRMNHERYLELEFGLIDNLGRISYSSEYDVENYYKFLRSQKYVKLEGLKDFSIVVPSGYTAYYFAYDADFSFLGRYKSRHSLPKSASYCKILMFKELDLSLTTNVCSNFIEYPGCIVRGATGLIEEQGDYNTSEMFAILPSAQYVKNNLTFLAFYDADKQYISREDNPYGTPFTTPSNAHYARVSSNTDPSLWQLNVGDTLLDYEYPASALVAKEEIKVVPNVTIRYSGCLEYCYDNLEPLVFHKIIYGVSHSINRCDSLDESILQDTINRDVDYANLMLPPNYSVVGEPVRLAYFCHGSNGLGWGEILCGEYYDLCKYVAKEGYAIMEIFGISYNNKDKATDNIGLPIAMTSFIESYKWAKSHLNIKNDGVVVWGKSAGGGPIGNLLYQKQIPILAVAGLAPISDIYNEIFRNRDARAKKFYAEQLGFEGEFEWANRPVGSEQQQLEFQYLLQNADKGIGSNPVWNGIIGLNTKVLLQESFKNPYNNFSGEYPDERDLYESMPKIIPVPYKVWIARDDRNVDPRHYDYWVKMAKNTGSYYELRYLPEGTGAHHAVDTDENAIKANVQPKYSNETLSIPIAYIEMIAWWRRYGG